MTGPDRSFSVPGNILLMGEYAVLEEGGLGVTVAVETRARVTLASGPSLLINASWAGNTIAWTPERPDSSSLLSSCVEVVAEWLGKAQVRWGATISIDSAAFFASGRRKTGLGSSAAVTVAAVVALLTAAGVAVDQRMDAAQNLAIAAHRRAQDGVGSGYDVMTSLNGGTGLFRGGKSPSWEARALAEAPTLLLFPGECPVVTTRSIQRYAEWKNRNPGAARQFLADSNEAVNGFLSARSLEEAAPWFATARRLGIALGASIGVSALIEPPVGLDPDWCKSVGAGNEMGICIASRITPDTGEAAAWRRIVTAREGIRWEE